MKLKKAKFIEAIKIGKSTELSLDVTSELMKRQHLEIEAKGSWLHLKTTDDHILVPLSNVIQVTPLDEK